jgi:hypothetical protein
VLLPATGPGVALPADVLRGLGTDHHVLACEGRFGTPGGRDGGDGGTGRFRSDWVAGHRLDLDGDREDDWVAVARHPCLRTADGPRWWLYAEANGARRLLLAGEPGTALELEPDPDAGAHASADNARAQRPVRAGFRTIGFLHADGSRQRFRYVDETYVPAPAE